MQGDLAIYAHTVDMHSPPAQARERLMKQVAREKKAVPIERGGGAACLRWSLRRGVKGRIGRGWVAARYLTEDEEPKRSLAAKVLPWVGWAVAAGFAVAAGSLYHERDALRSRMTTHGRADGPRELRMQRRRSR